eukprot:TRINITY_DN9078_c0_g1_i1.p1 TRINITY_DN9078_c0_g1~~TRINITY_DN9078_c0_g1_i1.p1  ORF type:complete len:837 (+),score=248.98 TRINITY_DN9078_c0_g1_i1:94-2604(+)
MTEGGVLSSAWRQPQQLHGFRTQRAGGGAGELPQWGLPKAEWAGGGEAFAVRPDGARAVLVSSGGSARHGTLTILEHSVSHLREHRRLVTVQVPFPVASVEWAASDRLLLGGAEGKVRVFNMAPCMHDGRLDLADILSQDPVAMCQPPKMKETRNVSTSVNNWTYSSRVVHVETCASQSKFISIENARMHVWDLETGAAVVRPVRASAGTLLSASCSPTSDFVFATGSATGGAKVVDVRGKTDQVWKAVNAHGGIAVVRKVAMSPLVPHWLATAADGGSIRIWDIRMGGADGGAPVLEFQHHQCLLTGLVWSPLHAEVLASSGVDGSMRISSLSHAPSYAVASGANASPTVGMGFTSRQAEDPQSCVTIASTSGEVTSYALSPIFMEGLSTPRFGASDAYSPAFNELAADCERLARLRHLKDATLKTRKAIEQAMDAHDTPTGMDLAALLHHHTPAPLGRDVTLAQARQAFAKDLRMCVEKLPPLYPFTRSTMLTRLEANLTYEHLYDTGAWEQLAEAVHNAVSEQGLERAVMVLQGSTFVKVVKGMARHTWTVGCDMFLRAEEVVRDQLDAEEAVELVVHLLGEVLGPLDNDQWPQQHIDELVTLRTASQMLYEPNSGERIVALVEKDAGVASVVNITSGALLRLYATALMQTAAPARVVWVADWLAAAHPTSPPAAYYEATVEGLKDTYKATLAKVKRRGYADANALRGKALVDALSSALRFAVDLAVFCRQLVYVYHKNARLHRPAASGTLIVTADVCLGCGEEARSALALLQRQAEGADSAVKQECDAARVEARAELLRVIGATQWGNAGTHEEQLSRQAAAFSEVLAKSMG